ncbi:MAG: metalloregulator ArsR/SmtB family transcription factor [Alphaproteobacteria bacterium]|nr:metalloregulator ArsR/SmtB family transcription factor [Alphaproteobacteria bacterium]
MKKSERHAENMEDALKMLKILGHPLRLSILCTLIDNGEMSAGDIVTAESDRASQSQISQYLNALKNEGIIQSRREGHFLYYKIADKRIKILVATLRRLFCQP